MLGSSAMICRKCGEPFSATDFGWSGKLTGCPCCNGEGVEHRVITTAEAELIEEVLAQAAKASGLQEAIDRLTSYRRSKPCGS